MPWTFENCSNRGFFDDVSGIHDRDPIGHFSDHPKVVADEEKGHSMLFLQLAQQVENLDLNRDVQRSGWFIGNQQCWFTGQCHGNHYPLTHTTTEFVWIA
jgi:hypothetical protein